MSLNLKPMYAGPYKIKEYVEGQYIIYERTRIGLVENQY